MIGFKLDGGALFSLECYYKYETENGSCKVGSRFFTMVKEAVTWLINEATEFFSDVGDTICEVYANVANSIANAADAIADYAE